MIEIVSPTYFADPIISFYSIFKMFTLEGWYEIPEAIAKAQGPYMAFLTRFYFIFVVVTGGIFGLSLVNAIFVDEMVSDNNDVIEAKIDRLEAKIDRMMEEQES